MIVEFEDNFAQYQRKKFALSFSSGTASMHAALFAVGVANGDEVLQTANTWASAITPIINCGGIPVFCDAVKNGYTIDPEDIRNNITSKTKAIIVTHLWGIPAKMDEIFIP